MADGSELLTLREFVEQRKAQASRYLWEPQARELARKHLDEFHVGILEMAELPDRMSRDQWCAEINAFREFKLRQNT